ncbi:MAG: LysM peptidoglycan-binding domain-containing protein [Gammaproteobacteria bacterium]
MYPGGEESQDKPSSQHTRSAQETNIDDRGGALGEGRSNPGVISGKGVEEDDLLKLFEDEIASAGRTSRDGIGSHRVGTAQQSAAARESGVPPYIQRSDSVGSPAPEATSDWSGRLREQARRYRPVRRLGLILERLQEGFGNWRRGFATLPRRSQRWVLIAGIAGVSAILWGLFAPSSQGPQSANAAQLLAQEQMSSSMLKRQLQELSGELESVRTERQRLRNEVDALKEERDWLAARLDAVASAGAPVIEGTVPPAADPISAGMAGAARPATSDSVARTADTAAPGDYEVGAGDTLWSIARRHDADVKQLAAANGISLSDPLKLGQRLVIPGREGVSNTHSGDRADEMGTDKGPSRESPPQQVEYTVKRGETLYGISRQFDVSVEQLRKWNSLGTSEVLQPSQRLVVRVDGETNARALP